MGIAAQWTFKERSARKAFRANGGSVRQAGHESVSSFPAFVQLKTECPCDGGCPRCAPVVQPKLMIGAPNDKYEQEADRIAEQVMAMPEPAVQRAPS